MPHTIDSRKLLLFAVTFAACQMAAANLLAQEPGAAAERRLDESEEASGIFAPFLHGRGPVSAEYVYTGEVFNNMRGGLNTTDATRYRGNFDLFLLTDLEKLGVPIGGEFMIYAQNGHGRGVTLEDVGDIQFISNIDALDFMQVSEYWWERKIFDNAITFRIGKMDANYAFASVETAQDFINSSFGLHPTIPMPTFPDPSAGVTISWEVTDWLTLQAGFWDGVPDGRNWGFSGTGEVFSIYEADIRYKLFGALPGEIHMGPWYHSGRWNDMTEGSSASFRGNYGFHFEMQQAFFLENICRADDEKPQGLGAFFQYAWAPEDRNEVYEYYGAGVVYWGLLKGRDEDVIGAGVAHVKASCLIHDFTQETAIELFYKAQITDNVMFQPDMQFVANPGCDGRDAFVFGVRMELAL